MASFISPDCIRNELDHDQNTVSDSSLIMVEWSSTAIERTNIELTLGEGYPYDPICEFSTYKPRLSLTQVLSAG